MTNYFLDDLATSRICPCHNPSPMSQMSRNMLSLSCPWSPSQSTGDFASLPSPLSSVPTVATSSSKTGAILLPWLSITPSTNASSKIPPIPLAQSVLAICHRFMPVLVPAEMDNPEAVDASSFMTFSPLVYPQPGPPQQPSRPRPETLDPLPRSRPPDYPSCDNHGSTRCLRHEARPSPLSVVHG